MAADGQDPAPSGLFAIFLLTIYSLVLIPFTLYWTCASGEEKTSAVVKVRGALVCARARVVGSCWRLLVFAACGTVSEAAGAFRPVRSCRGARVFSEVQGSSCTRSTTCIPNAPQPLLPNNHRARRRTLRGRRSSASTAQRVRACMRVCAFASLCGACSSLSLAPPPSRRR